MFRNVLEDIRSRVEGTVAVSLMGLDGISVESINDDAMPLDVMGAEFGGFMKSIRLANSELNTGDIAQFSVITEKYATYLSAVSAQYYLLLLVRADGNQGRARYELTRAKRRILAELG